MPLKVGYNVSTPYSTKKTVQGPKLPSGGLTATSGDKAILKALNKSTDVLGTSTSGGGYTTAKNQITDLYGKMRSRDAERQKQAENERKSIFEEERRRAEEAERAAAARRASLTGKYTTTQQALIEKLQGLENPETALSRFSTEEGLTEAVGVTKGLREQIDRINKTLRGLDENVTSRSLQSGLTEAQRQRLVTSEADPLREQLAEVSLGLGSAVENVRDIRDTIGQRLAAFTLGQEQSLEPLRQAVAAAGAEIDFELPFIADKLARDITQYSAERQSSLDSLLGRITRGEALDDAELVEASALAKEEAGYVGKFDELKGYLDETKTGQSTTGSSKTGTEESAGLGGAGVVNKLTDEDIGYLLDNPELIGALNLGL